MKGSILQRYAARAWDDVMDVKYTSFCRDDWVDMEILRGLMHPHNDRHMAFEREMYERLQVVVISNEMNNRLFREMLPNQLQIAHYVRCFLWTWYHGTPSDELLMPEYADALHHERAHRFIVCFQAE